MRTRNALLLLPAIGLLHLTAWSAPHGFDPWLIKEVFSNADGTIQFIELQECCGAADETWLPGSTLSSNPHCCWDIPGGPLIPPTSNRHYLIATSAFAALPGAPTPDAIIPDGLVPFFWDVDCLALSGLGGADSWCFGGVPTDGINSLKRLPDEVSVNDPTNYAGETGSVNASLTTYCIGKTTSQGCVPFLTTSGYPSATAADPFNIFSDDHVEGQIGVYLYSFQKANLNFHGGKLCVKAPIQRLTTLVKATDGIPCTSCFGNCRLFKRNFNHWIQSSADPMLTPGQNVKVQVRQRDPADPTGFEDNLSDGLAFTIGP